MAAGAGQEENRIHHEAAWIARRHALASLRFKEVLDAGPFGVAQLDHRAHERKAEAHARQVLRHERPIRIENFHSQMHSGR